MTQVWFIAYLEATRPGLYALRAATLIDALLLFTQRLPAAKIESASPSLLSTHEGLALHTTQRKDLRQ